MNENNPNQTKQQKTKTTKPSPNLSTFTVVKDGQQLSYM